MSITSASRLKSIAVIVGVLAVCAPLAAQDPGGKTYEVIVSLVPPEGDPFPVACTCLGFDALVGQQQTACLRSFNSSGRQQLLALWSFSSLDLVEGVTEVQATTGASLPSVCGGPRAGFEGFAFHGTVNGPIFDLDLEVIAEVAPRLRLLQGWEVEDCSQACQP